MKTSKFLLIMLTAGLFVLPAYTQKTFYLIPRAGLNLATISPTGGSVKPGLNFGVSSEFMVTSRWGAELGAYYSMQGTDFRDGDLNPEHDYLTIPLLAKFYLKGDNYWNKSQGLNFFAGPQVDVNVFVNKVGFTPGSEGSLLAGGMNKRFGFSAVAGVGYLLKVGLMISANLNYGLTNIAVDNYQTYDERGQKINGTRDKSYKNTVVQINFGYRFSLKK